MGLHIFMCVYGSQTWPIKWNAVSSRQRSYRYCYMDALLLYSHLHHHSASQRNNIKDRRTNKRRNDKDAGRHKKTSLTTKLPLTLLQGFERVVEGLHVKGCWRPNINFIFWPHCYDRHVMSFMFWCWGPLYRGFSECPLGRVWPSLPPLVSTVWKSAGNCSGTQTQLS